MSIHHPHIRHIHTHTLSFPKTPRKKILTWPHYHFRLNTFIRFTNPASILPPWCKIVVICIEEEKCTSETCVGVDGWMDGWMDVMKSSNKNFYSSVIVW